MRTGMTYPKETKKAHKRKTQLETRIAQAKIYDESGSFNEYALKCTVCGIRRKSAFFGLADPFWFYYAVRESGCVATALKFSIPMTTACLVALGFTSLFVEFGETAGAVIGGIIGGICYPISMFFVMKMSECAMDALVYARDGGGVLEP